MISKRNAEAKSKGDGTRVIKPVDVAIIGNAYSDVMIHIRCAFLSIVNRVPELKSLARWYYESTCIKRVLFNESVCRTQPLYLPEAADAIQLAYEQPTTGNQYAALMKVSEFEATEKKNDRDPYDIRLKVGLVSVMLLYDNLSCSAVS